MTRAAAFLSLMCTFPLVSCSTDDCKKYSRFTCSELQEKKYNVFYYEEPASGGEMKETFLGEVNGLNSCGTTARTAAFAREDRRQGEWSYICCLKTDTDSCLEKHR